MKLISSLFFLTVFAFQITAQVTQEWVKYYNSPGDLTDIPRDVAVDAAGYIYISGSSGLYPSLDYTLIKYSPSGEIVWVRQYAPNNNYNRCFAMTLDNDGNIYLTGESYHLDNNTDSEIATIKFDSSGAQLWVQIYNSPANDVGEKIGVDENNNIYVGGRTFESVLIKYNSSGVEQWVQPTDGYIRDMAIDNGGKIYIAGSTIINNNVVQVVRNYNTDGLLVWEQYPFGASESNEPLSIKVDADVNVYVMGRYDNKYATAKYNANGVEQWTQFYGQQTTETIPFDMALDNNGNCYITGYERPSTNSYAATTIKYGTNGEQLWIRTYGPDNIIKEFRTIETDNDGQVYIYGQQYGTLNYFTLIKYSSDGDTLWEQTYNSPVGSYQNPNRIAIDDSFNVYATGQIIDSSSNDYFLTIKYSQGDEQQEKFPPTNLSYDFDTHSLRWNKSLSNNVYYYRIFKQQYNPWTNTAGEWISAADSGGNVNKNDSIWTIQTSGFYNYKVGAVFATDTLFSDSIFVEIGYFLRKVEDNKVIAYNSETDLFKLIRNSDNWPASWYNQFNYNNPFSYSPLILFNGTPNQTYCDWPLFTEIIGNDQAYINEPLNISNLISVYAWKVRSSPIYNGSCAGFSISSILNFYQDQNYLQQFPYMVNKTPGLIPNTDSEARKVINHLQNTQTFPYPTMLNYEPSDPNNSNANYVLNRLIEIFSNYNNTRLDQYISLTSNDSGLHAVVPFAIRMVSGRPNRYDIQVYDSNDPENIYGVQIHTDKNTWSYIGLLVDSSTSGIALRGSIVSRLGLLTWKEPENGGGGNGPLNVNATERIIYISDSSSVAISINDEVIAGYNISNNSILSFENSIVEATDGAFNPPKGFIVPNVESKVIFSDQIPGSKASMMFQSDSKNYYVAERTSNALNGEVETIEIINEGFNYLNTDNINKSINLTTMSETYQNNKFAQLSNLIIDQNDSLGFWLQNDSLNLKNMGGIKNYKITLINADLNGKSEFINEPVSISANSTHILSPDWADLENDVLLVLIDNNNDGMIDDSLLLPNQYDPLPVELTSFTAKRLHNSIRLDWQTATEVNNYGFEIERKLNVKGQMTNEWIKIGFAEGSGNSNSPKNYSYLDKSATKGVYAYRLKQIDNDGTFSYSEEVVVNLNEVPAEFSLDQNYPNPFNPVTQIDFSLAQTGFVTLNIYNSIGQLIRALVNEKLEPGNYNYEWNATDNYGNILSSGIYFYRLQAGSFVETKKMILLR